MKSSEKVMKLTKKWTPDRRHSGNLPRKNFPVENSPAGFSGEKPNGAGAMQTTSATFPEAGNTTRRQAAGSALRYDAALREKLRKSDETD